MTTLFYNPGKTNIYEFQNDNKELIFNLTIKAIKECLKKNLKELKFLTIDPDNTVYYIRSVQFKDTINKALSYYESVELYENCSECIELLKIIY